MAFRRKATHRRSSKRLETRSHANRVFKRVVRQWELALNIKCQNVLATPGPDCPNGGSIILLANTTLQGGTLPAANFPDAVRIKRTEGHLYFKPENSLVDPDTDCLQVIADQANHNVYFRMGLKKSEGPEGLGGVSPAFNPLANGATPFDVSDYADGRWMKMWEHLWGASGHIGTQFQPAAQSACCGTQAGYDVPSSDFTLGTGVIEGYSVPPVVCNPCDSEDPSVQGFCGFTADVHRWWHCPIRFGRPIVMKENDNLNLWFGWERFRSDADAARLVQPNMKFIGGVRLLLES